VTAAQGNVDITRANPFGLINQFTISPALPTGLTFGASDARISGRPTGTASMTLHTVTAACTSAGFCGSAVLALIIDPGQY